MSNNRLFPRRKPEFIEPGIPKPGFFTFPVERDYCLHSHGRHANGKVSVKSVIMSGVVWPVAELEGSLVMSAVLIPGSTLEGRIGKAAAGRLIGRLVAFAEMLRAFGTGVEEELGPDDEPDYEPDFEFDPAARDERLRRKWDADKRRRKAERKKRPTRE